MAKSKVTVVDEAALETFVELCARGAKQYEAYLDAFGNKVSVTSAKVKASQLMTDDLRERIERRRREIDAQCIDVADVYTELTKEKLLRECAFVMEKAKVCVARNVEGVGVINKAAADILLKSVEVAAKLIGAYEQEEKVDASVVVEFADEIKELSR